jgi:lysophospholipase L1-like esterase
MPQLKTLLQRSITAATIALCACQGQALINPPDDPNATRIMPLGDSITQANQAHNSYRRLLWQKLRQVGYNVNFVGSTRAHYGGYAPASDFDRDHEGHWGWHVDEFLPRIAEWTEKAKPDIVLLHLGTNDLASGQAHGMVISEIVELVKRIRQVNPRVKILLAQLIPYGRAAQDVDAYNFKLKGVAKDLNTKESSVIVVDQFTDFSVERDTYDGLHPDESGEAKIADRWFQALQEVLPKKN